MIIPVKCFTCGKVLANKYDYFLREVTARKMKTNSDPNKVMYLTSENFEKTHEGHVLDEIGLTKMCCRRHILTHVDVV